MQFGSPVHYTFSVHTINLLATSFQLLNVALLSVIQKISSVRTQHTMITFTTKKKRHKPKFFQVEIKTPSLTLQSKTEKEREVATFFQTASPMSLYVLLVRRKGKTRVVAVEKYRAEGWANDMDVEGTPCQCGLLWWQETWERTSRPFKFGRESWRSYLLWAILPSSNLCCAALPLSHSKDRGCTHMYEKSLVCFLEICCTTLFLL